MRFFFLCIAPKNSQPITYPFCLMFSIHAAKQKKTRFISLIWCNIQLSNINPLSTMVYENLQIIHGLYAILLHLIFGQLHKGNYPRITSLYVSKFWRSATALKATVPKWKSSAKRLMFKKHLKVLSHKK